MTEPWALAGGLTAVALLHGAATGALVAAGRDGRVHHRRTEGRGALRGMAVTAALWAPLVVLGAAYASGGGEALDSAVVAMTGMAVVYAPVAVITVLAFGLARVGSWQVRASINAVVLGGLAFARPAIAWAGVVLGAWWARDVMLALLMVVAVGAGLLVPRVLSWRWYDRPRAVSTRVRPRH